MKHATIGDLSRASGISVAHLRRLALAGEVPGAIKRVGKHLRFCDCPKLRAWIASKQAKRQNREDRKKIEGHLRAERQKLRTSAPGPETDFRRKTIRFVRDYCRKRGTILARPSLQAEVRKILEPVLENLGIRS